jgi:hypothetical protein
LARDPDAGSLVDPCFGERQLFGFDLGEPAPLRFLSHEKCLYLSCGRSPVPA